MQQLEKQQEMSEMKERTSNSILDKLEKEIGRVTKEKEAIENLVIN